MEIGSHLGTMTQTTTDSLGAEIRKKADDLMGLPAQPWHRARKTPNFMLYDKNKLQFDGSHCFFFFLKFCYSKQDIILSNRVTKYEIFKTEL